ncbi:sensor domain-containing diguanylate cyclase [Candidatus Chloroploca sp. Khr17]|uniref:sensor domain-containing diguanylate cyclase n=1 Tax=Candidatus Chloroploca sp. Khr17 TaxID=2496869 RepID=UPI00101D9037|nr:sensor domain-containing diguanylate cyclase [Candidatus Chloroploca sp. Khr17]
MTETLLLTPASSGYLNLFTLAILALAYLILRLFRTQPRVLTRQLLYVTGFCLSTTLFAGLSFVEVSLLAPQRFAAIVLQPVVVALLVAFWIQFVTTAADNRSPPLPRERSIVAVAILAYLGVEGALALQEVWRSGTSTGSLRPRWLEAVLVAGLLWVLVRLVQMRQRHVYTPVERLQMLVLVLLALVVGLRLAFAWDLPPLPVYHVLVTHTLMFSLLFAVIVGLTLFREPTSLTVTLSASLLMIIISILTLFVWFVSPNYVEQYVHNQNDINIRFLLHDQLWSITIATVVTNLILILIFPLVFSVIMARSLQAVLVGMRQWKLDSANTDIPVYFNDEIGLLTQEFNRFDRERYNLIKRMEERINVGTIALVRAGEKYRDLFEFESDANFVVRSSDGKILEANSAAAALYGFSQEELKQMRNVDLSAEPEATHQRTIEVQPSKEIVRIPLRWHRRRDGTVFPVEITARFIEWDGEIVHIVSIRDITERHKIQAELERLATTDALTGVYNRRYFFEHGIRLFLRAKAGDTGGAIFMLDLDHFKLVNDTYGHSVGDLVICEFARRIRAKLRPGDILARYGGEEFIALMMIPDQKDLPQLAERLLQVVSSSPFVFEDVVISVTTSLGIAPFHPAFASFGQQVDLADDALYQAKEAGRNCWRMAVFPDA